METIRERIARILREAERPLTAYEIALRLGMDPRAEREIYTHIAHLAKSVRRRSGGREFVVMFPPRCRNCGYVFRDIDRPRRPSRCPSCRSTRIMPPMFMIASRQTHKR